MLLEYGNCRPGNWPGAGRLALGPSPWHPRKDVQSYCCDRRLMGVKNRVAGAKPRENQRSVRDKENDRPSNSTVSSRVREATEFAKKP